MQNTITYHRPETVDEAVSLLARSDVRIVALAGGTQAVAELGTLEAEEVVDLQALPLREIDAGKLTTTIGATATLQAVAEHERLPATVREAAFREGPNTLRHAATLGGTIVRAASTSELLATLLVQEAKVDVVRATGLTQLPLSDLLADMSGALGNGLITAVSFSQAGGPVAAARVGRTPADAPIVAAVARRAPGGRMLLALCGVASTPLLVDPDNVADSIDPPGDFRGSAAYRRQMAQVLAERVLMEVA